MKLFDTFARRSSSRGFHSTVVTTFGIDFAAFEQVLLPQFVGAGSGNVVLLSDPGMLALSLGAGLSMPRAAGADYVVHPVARSGGVFHPKIIFQVGRDGARVVIGSANTTTAGLSGNREVVTEVSCNSQPSPERAFIVAVWAYLADLVGTEGSPAFTALSWLESRTPWLAEAQDDPEIRVWSLSDGTRLGFFANEGTTGSITDRFLAEVGGAPVSKLVVMSPYWDPGLNALRALIESLRPAETKVLIQADHRLFPGGAVGGLPIDVHEIVMPGKKSAGTDPSVPTGRFSHAKLVIATADGVDHILSGSANCTLAALGARGRPGVNAEASVYRRLPAGAAEEWLKLDQSLTVPAIPVSMLPPVVVDPALPLDAANEGTAGTFEMGFDYLVWLPANGFGHSAIVELLSDAEAEPIAQIDMTSWISHGAGFRTPMSGTAELVRFARVRSDGRTSSIAIVARREALRQKRRERANRGLDQAAAALSDRSSVDFRWLDLLTLLERDDLETQAGFATVRRMSRQRATPEAVEHKRLEYDDFIKVRRPQHVTGVADIERNMLAGTSVDLMRAVLNELISGGHPPEPVADLIEEELPDEELVGHGSKRAAVGLEGDRSRLKKERLPELEGQGQPEIVPFDPRVYEKAVDAYRDKVRAQAEAGLLGPQHVLRLRLWLILLLSEHGRLACDGSNAGWPRLTIRVLLAFFGDPNPPIRRLAIDPRFDQLPNDLIEAWVAVLASLKALIDCCDSLRSTPDGRDLPPHIVRLDALVSARMGLTSDDLRSERLMTANESLSGYRSRIQHKYDLA